MDRNTIIPREKLPKHVAIIMDGNGRWAKQRLLSRSAGHREGAKRMEELTQHAFALGVEHVTLYALSTENLNRPKEELEELFGLLREHFQKYKDKDKDVENKQKIRFRALGDLSLLPEDIQEILREGERRTAEFTGKSVNLAVAYGGRSELVRAVNLAIERGEQVCEESFSKLLYTRDLPDPDLIIRTGKEMRLSNFLLYQAAYAELYFSEKMFPDFTKGDLEEAFRDYAERRRRYGKTDEQLDEAE